MGRTDELRLKRQKKTASQKWKKEFLQTFSGADKDRGEISEQEVQRTIRGYRGVDTNVVVAGISGFRGQYVAGRIPRADLLHRWADEEHFVRLYSEDILAEYKEVLKLLHVRSATIGTLINFIRERGGSIEIEPVEFMTNARPVFGKSITR